MKPVHALCSLCLLLIALAQTAAAAGSYFKVSYPASNDPKELQLGVDYTVWIPPGAKTLRGVIVHQHGCGGGACKGGETAAYDLHWQALAKKWDCALLGPSYHQADDQNCRLWCDPRNGSEKTFLKALDDLAAKSKHPELATVPWCLWGHSGGGFWASLMETLYPERIVAVWLRSGTAFEYWEKGEIPKPENMAGAYSIPTMLNPGVRERDEERFKSAWSGAMAMFQAYRKVGAPIGFAPDPRTAHECGDSRYLAISFFDACLAKRLPGEKDQLKFLKPFQTFYFDGWFAKLLSDKAEPAAKFTGEMSEAVWLPDAKVAEAWMQYVKTGAVSDISPPPEPFAVNAIAKPDGTTEITWEAAADFESGIGAFVILRDGKEIAQAPEQPLASFGAKLFQGMSYHDTPLAPLSEMRYTDKTAEQGAKHEYQVIEVNSVGLRSKPATAEAE